MKKRILSIILTACLAMGLMPTATFASENEQTGGIAASSLCEHHPEHTAECGYEAAMEGHACTHEHDESCGYAEAQACTHEHDEECGYAEASEGSPCTFTCDICEDEEELQENNLSQAVLAVQDLIDTIPEEFTEENYEDIADLLGEIDTLKEELTEEESALLDFTKYDEAVAKMMELMGQADTEEPALMTTSSCTCLIKCTAANNACNACKSGIANCTGRTKWVDKDNESIVDYRQLPGLMSWPASQRDYYYYALDWTIKNVGDSTVLVPVPNGANVIIDLNGNILDGNNKGTIFEVSGGGKLTIIDTVGTGTIKNASNGVFHILKDGSVLMLGGTIEDCTGKGAVIVESDGTFEMAGGTIKGDIHNEGKILYMNSNYGLGTKIYGNVNNRGTIDAHKGNVNSNNGAKFYSTVENNGTIVSGRFHTTVENNGTISGGVFYDDASITNNGTISGGEFRSTIFNNETGIISGGRFFDAVTSYKTIYNTSGIISGGEFNLPTVNNSTISGGTFNSQVKNDGVITDYIGEISGGTFYGYVDNRGVISGGIFYGTVETAKGTIQDSAYVTVYFVTNINKVIDTVKVLRGKGVPSSDIPQFKPQTYGYDEFLGWRNGEDEYTGGGQFTADENYIYAELSNPIKFDISYNLCGGTATNPSTYNVETETFTLENPTKIGYNFTGWSGTYLTGSDNMTVTIEQGSTKDRVFTANYTEKNNFTVNFNTNGGSSIPSKQNVKWTDRVLDNVETPKNGTLEFMGWLYNGNIVSENATYSQLVANDTVSSITLLAKWPGKLDAFFNKDPQTYVYDGTAKRFQIVAPSKPSDDYEISYSQNYSPVSNPTDIGSYDVLITRGEDSTYKRVFEFISNGLVITPQTVTATIRPIPDETYTGNDIEPAITVYVGDTQIPDSKYTVNYSNNRNAGTATVTLTDNSGGDYIISGSATFYIKPKTVTATISSIPDRTYTGKDIKPAITVYDGETVIPSNEYTISYTNNRNAGTATVTITDNTGGNYVVSGSTTFEIKPKEVTARIFPISYETYTGSDIKPAITVYDSITEIPADEYTISYTDNRDVGIATVTVTDNEGGNYTVSGGTYFGINPKGIDDAVITLSGALTYNGTKQTQNVTVELAGFTDVTFDVSGNKQTNVNTSGDYTLTVTGNGNFTGTKTLDWNIAPATPAENSAKKTTARVRKNRTLADASVSKGEILAVDGTPLTGTFAWVDSTKVMSADGTEQMTFTPGNTNYTPITIDVAVDVYSPSSSGDSSSGGSSTSSTNPTETSAETPVVGTIDNAADTSVKTETTTEATNTAAADAAKNDATINLITTTGTKVSSDSFKEPVILSIPANTNGVENVNNLTLARFNTETGKLEIIGGTYNAETNTVSGYITEAGDYFVVEKQGLLSMTLQVGNTDVTLNTGNKKLDVAPIISQDRTLVPLRFISESLGANVSWENATKNVTVELDGKKLNMQIGKEIEGFGAAPIISNNRTLVPIRYISEELGANVLWIPSTQTISIAGSNTNRMFLD